jgi:apolipoprotein N-acyltransferase
VPLIFGAYDVDGATEYNAAFFLGAPGDSGASESRLVATYRKAWPFPLTEHVPAFLDTPRVRAWLPWLGTWQAGTGTKVVPLRLADGRTLRVAPLICYDVLDPTLALAATRAGADLIVTLSNDSWFADGAGPRQHLLGAAFRSMETRRPQLRATNTGISAVITPAGDIVTRGELNARTGMIATVVPQRAPITLAVAWGDWLGPVALVLGALLLVSRPGRSAGSARSPRRRAA